MFSKLLKALEGASTFLISGHVNADPDALSSQLALGEFLKSQGKKVYLMTPEPVSSRLNFLPGISTIKAIRNRMYLSYDVAIAVDCGDISRLGRVRRLLKEDKELINIDHHVSNTRFGDINCIDSKASSTAEIVFRLFKKAGFAITPKIAELLYVGIMTDTGSFRYENTSARTHKIVSELVAFENVSPRELYQKIYETIPPTDLKYFTKLISEFDLLYDGKVASVDLPRRMARKFSDEFDLRDKIFGYLRAIKGVEVVVIFTEVEKHKTRINLRSHNRIDVAKIAGFFDGGGHSQASGCQLKCDMASAHRKVLRFVHNALRVKI